MIIELLAAAGDAAPQTSFGFWEAMEQGGFVAWFILSVMIIMSVGSFYILFTKLFEQQKVMNQFKGVRQNFWRATSLDEGAKKLDKNSAWRQLVDDAVKARDSHHQMGDSLEAHDWLHGSLARSEGAINSSLNGGLAFLATVGSTSPFIGLFGTVIGIYRALIKIGAAGQASIDAVAGPVGEALIMTALGLAVAVPAVLAYNFLQRRNKAIAEQLNGFTVDLLAYLVSDGAVKPTVAAAPGAPVAKPAATPTKA
ncbi:MotA/TolQ/ExbB proton channel family protein [Sphingobium abikonense]|uniref:MotA/TolQ/ExbB proton channel family protein n=1 Tax=Sphingobium abikonense TaxID=86193 RepID=UPI003515F3FD